MSDDRGERTIAGTPNRIVPSAHVIGHTALDQFDLLKKTIPGSSLEHQSLAELTRTLDHPGLSADLDFVVNAMRTGQRRG